MTDKKETPKPSEVDAPEEHDGEDVPTSAAEDANDAEETLAQGSDDAEETGSESSEEDDTSIVSETGDDEETSEDTDGQSEDELEEPWSPDVDPFASAEDAIDPELLALAEEKPAPKWHRPIVMAVVCVLIIVMMVWFWQDFLYFFSPSEPIELGEGHDVTFSEEWENRYVHLEAVPLAPRNENPSAQCGALQGFPTYQRRFLCRGHQSAIPVMGRPGHDLVIQRYLVRQLRISYFVAEGRDAEGLFQKVIDATKRVNAVHDVRPTKEGELGHLIVDVEGRAGKTDLTAVSKSIQYQIEASVPGIKRVMVERVRREIPGNFSGRLVRISTLGSRFAAVAAYLNECTSYPVSEEAWVVLDGSEAGEGLTDGLGMCYGQSPRQYWPYVVLYVFFVLIFIVNIILFVRFTKGIRKEKSS